MKVYVMTTNVVVEFEELGTTNRVFANKEKALKALKEWRDDEIFYVEDAGWTIGADTEDHFEAYLDGYYTQCHTEGFVNEYDVE